MRNVAWHGIITSVSTALLYAFKRKVLWQSERNIKNHDRWQMNVGSDDRYKEIERTFGQWELNVLFFGYRLLIYKRESLADRGEKVENIRNL